MTTQTEALKLALEALKCALSDDRPYIDECEKAITAIKEALAQPEEEEKLHPVHIGVDVTKEGTAVTAFYRKPNAVMEMFYSQFHPLAQPEPSPEWITEEEQTAYTFGWFKALESQRNAQPEQEPVAWESILGAVARGWCYEENANKTMDSELAVAIAKEVQALYTTPPQRKPWVSLSDEHMMRIASEEGKTRLWVVAKTMHKLRELNEAPQRKDPEQRSVSEHLEPVAWMSPNKERLEFSRKDTVYGSHTIPLYTTPPQRKSLTDEQIDFLNFLYGAGEWDGVWFEGRHPTKRGAFWWRKDMKRLFDYNNKEK